MFDRHLFSLSLFAHMYFMENMLLVTGQKVIILMEYLFSAIFTCNFGVTMSLSASKERVWSYTLSLLYVLIIIVVTEILNLFFKKKQNTSKPRAIRYKKSKTQRIQGIG